MSRRIDLFDVGQDWEHFLDLVSWERIGAAVHAFRLWLQAPSSVLLLPTASRTETLWLGASLLGLLVTGTNLVMAAGSLLWQRRHARHDVLMGQIARSRLERAVGFAAVDAISVGMGVAAVLDWRAYPFVLLFGLLAIRLLLPALAVRDLQVYRQALRLIRKERRRGHVSHVHPGAAAGKGGTAPHG